MEDLILSATHISRSYGDVIAVDDLSMKAYAGEIIGLLGPNGAGKTTAIRVLTTILPPTRGSFTILDIPYTEPFEIRKHIGVLPENTGFPEHQTGREFLMYHARLYGQTGQTAREAADALLVEVGLGERADARIGTYSRGMRQRLGVARALVNEPQLIVLDEPTLGLDPAGQRQMLRLIEDLATRRRATVILSTHFLNEVEGVCSRVLILNHGQLVAQGTIADVKRQAGAPQTGWYEIPPDSQELAMRVLRETPGVMTVEPVTSEPTRLRASYDRAWLEQHAETGMNAPLGALVEARVPVIAFEYEGTSLNDAFLALTGEQQS